MMDGIQSARRTLGPDVIHLKIISAGYGLVDEGTSLCPYNVTFKGMGRLAARRWARKLQLPTRVRAAVADAELAVFLLGEDYLSAIELVMGLVQ